MQAAYVSWMLREATSMWGHLESAVRLPPCLGVYTSWSTSFPANRKQQPRIYPVASTGWTLGEVFGRGENLTLTA